MEGWQNATAADLEHSFRMAHSLASSTGTRVDSASKHIVPCRMATDYMVSLISSTYSDNPGRELQINKHKYCMAKDDVVIGLGRPLFGSSAYYNRKKAYPSVITSLAQMDENTRKFMASRNFFMEKPMKPEELDKVKQAFVDGLKDDAPRLKAVNEQISNMLDFYVVGISLGTAWAHPSTGDTVASVMIGGLRTILNGHFPIHTNDPICIYFEDELIYFESDGSRKDRKGFILDENGKFFKDGDGNELDDHDSYIQKMSGEKNIGMTKAERTRKGYHGRENGTYPATPTSAKSDGKMHVARIKPYIVSKHLDQERNVPQHFPCDKARIFAKAISNAQPFEKVDIMICRQSL